MVQSAQRNCGTPLCHRGRREFLLVLKGGQFLRVALVGFFSIASPSALSIGPKAMSLKSSPSCTNAASLDIGATGKARPSRRVAANDSRPIFQGR